MDKIFIGNISFTPKTRCVDQEGREIKLRNKESEILFLLCELYPDPVSRDQIEKMIWADSYVTDNTLTQTISNLRNSLNDKKHELIITIPKKGYSIGIKPEFNYYESSFIQDKFNFSAKNKINNIIEHNAPVHTNKLYFPISTWLTCGSLFLIFLFLSFVITNDKYQIKIIAVEPKNLPILINLDEKQDERFLKDYKKPHYILLKKDNNGNYFFCYRYKTELTCVKE